MEGWTLVRTLALDVGERRVGVALSDPTGLLATPLTTLFRSNLSSDVAAVLSLAQEHQAGEIVVGLPISLSGRLGPQAKVVGHFFRALQKESSIPVKTWDERFSTQEAERRLREAGVKAGAKKGVLDAAAAAVILQSYLDSSRS